MLTQEELVNILRQAANTLKAITGSHDPVYTMPCGASHFEVDDDGWVQIGWLYDALERRSWEVFWHPERGSGGCGRHRCWGGEEKQ